MYIGERIKVWREKKGWNQRELARHAQIDHAWISRLEAGTKHNISLDAARRLATVLGVSVDYLAGMYGDSDERPAAVALVEAWNQGGSSPGAAVFAEV